MPGKFCFNSSMALRTLWEAHLAPGDWKMGRATAALLLSASAANNPPPGSIRAVLQQGLSRWPRP